MNTVSGNFYSNPVSARGHKRNEFSTVSVTPKQQRANNSMVTIDVSKHVAPKYTITGTLVSSTK